MVANQGVQAVSQSRGARGRVRQVRARSRRDRLWEGPYVFRQEVKTSVAVGVCDAGLRKSVAPVLNVSNVSKIGRLRAWLRLHPSSGSVFPAKVGHPLNPPKTKEHEPMRPHSISMVMQKT